MNNSPLASPAHSTFATFHTLANGTLLVQGDADTLYDYIKPMARSVKKVLGGVKLTKNDARLKACIPVRLETLESGAVLEWYVEGVGVRGEFSNGYLQNYMGIAQDLPTLERFFTHDFGPEQFLNIFGKEANAEDIQEYQDQQSEIKKRKEQNAADDKARLVDEAKRFGLYQLLDPEDRDALMAERDKNIAQWDSKKREDWMASVGVGVVSNKRYQAFLDTVEDVEAIAKAMSNAPYMAFITDRCAEYERTEHHSPTSANQAWQEGFTVYCQNWAKEHLSERVKEKRQC